MIKAANRFKLPSLASLFLTGCASVTSIPYSPDERIDGILYKLPATEIVGIGTWRLTNCERVQLELEALEIAHRVVPDKDHRAWFIIDPDELHDLFTSVNPASIELRDGMLGEITYKATSELREIIKTGAGLAARIASGGIVGLENVPATTPACRPEIVEALKGKGGAVASATARLQAAEKDFAEVERRFLTTPNENLKLAVDHVTAKLAGARAALAAASADGLRLKAASTALPTRGDPALAFSADLQPLETWFVPWGEGSGADKWLRGKVALTGDIVVTDDPGGAADEPVETYPGIYYRVPVRGFVTVKDTAGKQVRNLDAVPIAQLGRTARLKMQNIPFGSRGFTVKFDPSGRLQKFDATSTSIAKEAVATAAEARAAAQSGVGAELQAEIDLLKKQEEKIKAEQALKKAQAEAGSVTTGAVP